MEAWFLLAWAAMFAVNLWQVRRFAMAFKIFRAAINSWGDVINLMADRNEELEARVRELEKARR
jgi:hypothetical protein